MSFQRQRQQSTQSQGFQHSFVPVPKSGGPTFSGGIMFLDGVQQEAVRILDTPSSNGLTKYSTVIWRDPNTGELRVSCNCNGWAIARSSTRSCKHTRQLQDNPTLGRTLAEAVAEVARTPAAVSPQTTVIVAAIGKSQRSIMI
jgi:hypothetical protein